MSELEHEVELTAAVEAADVAETVAEVIAEETALETVAEAVAPIVEEVRALADEIIEEVDAEREETEWERTRNCIREEMSKVAPAILSGMAALTVMPDLDSESASGETMTELAENLEEAQAEAGVEALEEAQFDPMASPEGIGASETSENTPSARSRRRLVRRR